MKHPQLDRTLGLAGAIFLIVGNVVGASIFILPGELAGLAGPAVFLAYLIASIPALLNCVIAAQVGVLFPVSCSPYVMTARVLSPLLGFMLVWINLIVVVVAVPVLALGFADYLALLVPQIPKPAGSVGLVILLGAVNLFGLRRVAGSQSLMIAMVLAILAIYALACIGGGDVARMQPLFPKGLSPVLLASVPAFYSFFGFFMITFIAEEVREPERNIPIALAGSFAVVTLVYSLVTIATVMAVPVEALVGSDVPLVDAARGHLPSWFATILSLCALLATATTINSIILMSSRSVLALGRAQIFPAVLAKLSSGTRQPIWAVALVTGLALIGLALGGSIIQYAKVSVVSFMLFGIVWSIALLRLPSQFPELYRTSKLRLSTGLLWCVVVLKIATSILFGFLGVADNLGLSLVFAAFLAIGVVYYFVRVRILASRGVDFRVLLAADES